MKGKVMPNLIRYINQNDPETNLKEEIFQRVLKRTFDEEGGFEDRKNRIEMPTNMGIRQDTLERFKQKHPDLSSSYPSQVKDITKDQAAEIYKKDYFEPYGIGEINIKLYRKRYLIVLLIIPPKNPQFGRKGPLITTPILRSRKTEYLELKQGRLLIILIMKTR